MEVSWPWFSQFISTELSTFHDCCIAEYELVKNEMKLLRARTSGNTELFESDSAQIDANDEIISVGSEQ